MKLKKIIDAIVAGLDTIENKSKDLAFQKKLELKDELSKELTSRADLQLSETRLNAKIDNLEIKLEAKIDMVFAQLRLLLVVIISAIIIFNPKALELISKIFGIVK
ncbi:MAG: hypothetical protein HQK91_11925 [Nitrospirae bacterium]|nr:hypothetical protein [Nitrospirota bacterium]